VASSACTPASSTNCGRHQNTHEKALLNLVIAGATTLVPTSGEAAAVDLRTVKRVNTGGWWERTGVGGGMHTSRSAPALTVSPFSTLPPNPL
jgi:hypothetical protein